MSCKHSFLFHFRFVFPSFLGFAGPVFNLFFGVCFSTNLKCVHNSSYSFFFLGFVLIAWKKVMNWAMKVEPLRMFPCLFLFSHLFLVGFWQVCFIAIDLYFHCDCGLFIYMHFLQYYSRNSESPSSCGERTWQQQMLNKSASFAKKLHWTFWVIIRPTWHSNPHTKPLFWLLNSLVTYASVKTILEPREAFGK